MCIKAFQAETDAMIQGETKTSESKGEAEAFQPVAEVS